MTKYLLCRKYSILIENFFKKSRLKFDGLQKIFTTGERYQRVEGFSGAIRLEFAPSRLAPNEERL